MMPGELTLQLGDVPLRVLAALEKDVYRKPRTGMTDYLRQLYENKGWKVGGCRCVIRPTLTTDWANAMYVGDAAGRKTDHGNTDYTMALNAKIKFATPEVGVLGYMHPLTVRNTSWASLQPTQFNRSLSDRATWRTSTPVSPTPMCYS